VDRLFEIVHEDDELLVINKPAGLVCHPTKTDEYSSLISRVRLYLGKEPAPQMVNRLDRETSGIILVAKRADTARQLRRLWEQRQVEKEYVALVHGHVREEHGVIEAPLGKDERSRVAIKDCVRPDGAAARTEYWVLGRGGFSGKGRFDKDGDKGCDKDSVQGRGLPALTDGSVNTQPFSLLRVVPETGRKHQIRIHLAHIGHPIVGDKIYGGDEDLYLALVEDRLTEEQRRWLILPHHALHARQVRLVWRGEPRVFRAEAEGWFDGVRGLSAVLGRPLPDKVYVASEAAEIA
jgi:23S rRNA pseudouridine1911/1915/1917 synthase